MIDVISYGACGRMGRLIINKVVSSKDLNLIGAIADDDDPDQGKDIGVVIGMGEVGVSVTPCSKLSRSFENGKRDKVIIDFTNPKATMEQVRASFGYGVNGVIGTTGLSRGQLEEIEKIVKANGTSFVLSPNFSVGMNIFWEVSRLLAQHLEDYDVEIVEAHHKMKKDSPSGTAKKIAEIVSEGKKIPIHSIRAGDIAGDHGLIFAGAGERIELVHQAHSRDCFASGTIRAARWVAEKRDGRVHSMKDVLGI